MVYFGNNPGCWPADYNPPSERKWDERKLRAARNKSQRCSRLAKHARKRYAAWKRSQKLLTSCQRKKERPC